LNTACAIDYVSLDAQHLTSYEHPGIVTVAKPFIQSEYSWTVLIFTRGSD